MANEDINENAHENENVSNEGAVPDSAAAKRRAKMNLLSGRVIDYDQADDETRARMEEIMQPIDDEPDSFDAILDYGNAPLQKLGVFAEEMIRIQQRFDAQVNVVATTFGKLQSTFKERGMTGLADRVKKAASVVAKKSSSTFGRAWDAVTRKNAKKTDSQKLLDEVQKNIPALVAEMNNYIEDLEEAKEGIISVIKEANKLGEQQMLCNREILVYLGTQDEVKRRYAEEYIAEAQEEYEKNPTPELKQYIDTLTERLGDFIGHILSLESARNNGAIIGRQLVQITDDLHRQQKMVCEFLKNGQNEWKVMLAAAGFAGSSLKSAQTLEEMGNFGDKMLEQNMKMIEDAHKKTLNAGVRGVVDPEKLIEAAARMTQMIEESAKADEERMLKIEQTRAKLRESADRLIESVHQVENRKLESASTHPKTANDNQKKQINRKKSGNGGPKPA